MDFLGELALQGAHCGTCGTRRGCVNQISNGFGLSQIELVVLEGAARKLARFSETGAKLKAAIEQLLHDDRSTMPLQFEDIVTGKGMWCRKMEYEAAVDAAAVLIMKFGKRGMARTGLSPGQGLRERKQIRARDTDDTDASAARRRRDRGDRLAWLRLFCRHPRSSV